MRRDDEERVRMRVIRESAEGRGAVCESKNVIGRVWYAWIGTCKVFRETPKPYKQVNKLLIHLEDHDKNYLPR